MTPAAPPRGALVIEKKNGDRIFSLDLFETAFIIEPGSEYPRKLTGTRLAVARLLFAYGAAV